MHRSTKSTSPHTHEIQDETGEWLWMGDESSMSVIFNNISGVNFEGRHHAWLQYMAWMCWFHHQAWSGRASPFKSGAEIRLARIGGEQLGAFKLPATFDEDLQRAAHERQA